MALLFHKVEVLLRETVIAIQGQVLLDLLDGLRHVARWLHEMSISILEEVWEEEQARSMSPITPAAPLMDPTFPDWELLQAELLASSLPDSGWGEGLWCCNPGCTNLSGRSEMQLATSACAGGCGARYCSRACQEAAWRMGHRESCGRITAWRAREDEPPLPCRDPWVILGLHS